MGVVAPTLPACLPGMVPGRLEADTTSLMALSSCAIAQHSHPLFLFTNGCFFLYRIQNLDQSCQGTYVCQARGPWGQAQASAQLVVQGERVASGFY